MQYKSLSIDLDTAVHLVNVHYSAYLEKDPEGIYWSGSHEPLLVRGDLYRYFHYDKTLGEVPYDLSQGLPTKAVYAEVNAQPRVMVPQCLVQKKGLLSTQAIIPNVATCVVLAVIGDYIRHSVNSPYQQQEDFNLYQFMVDDEALAELALAQSGVFGINHDSAVNLLNRDGITLNDLGIAVGDEVGKRDCADRGVHWPACGHALRDTDCGHGAHHHSRSGLPGQSVAAPTRARPLEQRPRP
jgi:hypothetical protein